MEIVYRLDLGASMLAAPLLLGGLVYFRLRKHSRILAHVIGFIVPPVLTFYFVSMMLGQEFERYLAPNKGQVVCGLPALGAVMMLLIATGVQIFLSATVQGMLLTKHDKHAGVFNEITKSSPL